MPLFDSIINFFRRKPEGTVTKTPKEIQRIPMAETTNSITISPDLNTVYLIDNGRAIGFNLNHPNGINIGTLNGQITVSTALSVPLPDPGDDPTQPDRPDSDAPSDGPIPGKLDIPIKNLGVRPRYYRIRTTQRRFTTLFFKDKGVVSIIGASDIDLNIIGASDIDLNIIGASDIDLNIARRNIEPEPDPAVETPAEPENTETPAEDQLANRPQCLIYSFLIKEKSINIRKSGDLFIIQY